jgi:Heterokaryon incompatibility protein (HET)
LSHSALRGAQRYEEAIEAFTIMLSKLDEAPEAQIRGKPWNITTSSLNAYLILQICVSSTSVHQKQKMLFEERFGLNSATPPFVCSTLLRGLLCDRAAQLNFFKTSPEYKELLSSITKRSNLEMERIKEVVAMQFRCVLLSHRWEETEASLHHIQDKAVYELDGLNGTAKLQSFCKIARDAGYFWAWMDTCCIDKSNNVELQESVNSMFVWYRHSALTIVYLSDVPPSSPSGALASSVWNERGWTFQEFVAPKVVIFYQKDWSLYTNDRSPNHKESQAIIRSWSMRRE